MKIEWVILKKTIQLLYVEKVVSEIKSEEVK